MIYDLASIAALAQHCAPGIAPEALVPVVVTESNGNSLRINVNKGPRVRATTIDAAVALTRGYMKAGYSVDVGLAQINSANFVRLGVNVQQAFEPCTNLRLAAVVLQEGYARARRSYVGLDAISATYSLYNSGSMTRGVRNGYVGRVWANATASGAIAASPPLPVSSPAAASAGGTGTGTIEEAPWIIGQVDAGVEVFK